MPFPEVTRVLYRKNPLDEVVCQLRFPPILKIDAETPVDFQERVRRDFPNFSETSELKVELAPTQEVPIPPEVVAQLLKSSGIKNYEFSSEDENWKINLTRSFVALTTKKYQRWEEFKHKLQIPLNALIDIYSPTHFSRVGLRYMDVIQRSSLDLDDVSWDELLQPYITGILGAPQVSNFVHKFECKYEIELADGESVVRIITTFVETRDTGEICYKIDSDFYNSQKTPLESAMEKLDFFNVRASRLIQWCITDRLHEAMEPQPL